MSRENWDAPEDRGQCSAPRCGCITPCEVYTAEDEPPEPDDGPRLTVTSLHTRRLGGNTTIQIDIEPPE